jgi:hypothetical protein
MQNVVTPSLRLGQSQAGITVRRAVGMAGVRCLSRVTGNCHARFLGGKGAATPLTYPVTASREMKTSFRFKCSTCGEVHEGAPSFSFEAPIYYEILTSEEKREKANLGTDFCVIDEKDYFIRVLLEIHIHGSDEHFLWGVWVSVSQDNFEKYCAHFEDSDYEDEYFGWFSNKLPYYPDTLNIKTYALVRPDGQRPTLELEPSDHPLSVDYYNGISWQKAADIAEAAMHGDTS